MKTAFFCSSALVALFAPAAAFAQSAGSVSFEEDVIVVTGMANRSVAGVEIPDTSKAKQVLTAESIRRARPGQTANDIINLVPGVSFQNNDPWGSAGGGFTIRGFTSDRISQTLDGIPLNDSGNYALYTNQQVDPEILDSINVNLGVTDVDSPTASAVGGTINLRTRVPSNDFALLASGSYGGILAEGSGDRPYHRVFGMIDTGDFTGVGTSAFIAGSIVAYDNPFNEYGEVDKKQINGRIYQELGDNGDYISIAGHYNQNRNNFFGSFNINTLNDLIEDGDKTARFYTTDFGCTVDAPQAGVADAPNTCGTSFDRRFNPSNTGNIRIASRFSLMDNLVLTVEPNYQYVKANGGGTSTGYEYARRVNGTPVIGYISGRPYTGIDLNGDGDLLDTVTVLTPSQTVTNRYALISNLIWDLNDTNRIRLSYTHDYANHHQTGEVGYLGTGGVPIDVFPVNGGVVDSSGAVLQKRDRQSFAILDQVSGEYRGQFLEDALTVTLGLRAPFFKRELNQNCFTTSASGFVDCVYGAQATAYAAANPAAIAPTSRNYSYEKLLPNVGFTYEVSDGVSTFFNFAQGLSVPGTDPLYNSLYFTGADADAARPEPETTDSFDLGLRFTSGTIQAQLAGWYTRYNNRLASAYDPELDIAVYRNLGRVDKYGLDASIAWRPNDMLEFYVFGSLNESEIKENIQTNAAGDFLATAGKKESGTPGGSVGARGQLTLGGFDFGAQVKYTGKRYINDVNDSSVSGYTLVDLDARLTLMESPTGGTVAIQANITNLFDEFYVGSFGGGLSGSGFAQIGAPRAASISLIIGY